MQLYALDNTKLTLATEANKEKIYRCPECQNPVKLRGGHYRQLHFYHLNTPQTCRQHQKSLEHLQLQLYIQKLFTPFAQIEKPFPTINRIADVATPDLIIEIQYSPITQEEALTRTHDYESLGYQVIWILHDKHYNLRKPTPSEKILRATKCCYYSNMNAQGQGIIYDQPGNPINLTNPSKPPQISTHTQLTPRVQNWPYYFEGDLLDLYLKKKLTLPPSKKRHNPLSFLLHLLLESITK